MMLVRLATDYRGSAGAANAIHGARRPEEGPLSGAIKRADPDRLPGLGCAADGQRACRACGQRSSIANVMPPLANVAISNVPGSPVPLYLAGAKVRHYYPVSIPAHGVAFNITVQSYDGEAGIRHDRLPGRGCPAPT